VFNICKNCKILIQELNTLQQKYDVLGATCDQLWERLKAAESKLIQGKELVDRLMTVIEVNRQLENENARLRAIIEATEPPPDTEIKA